MKNETLLPCPFCGGEPEEEGGTFVEYYGHERQDYSITCKQCGAEVRCDVGDFEGADAVCSCHHNTRKICSVKWNRRAIQSGNSAQPVTVPAGYVLVSADFIDTVKQAFKEVGGRKSFPGHAHDVPGVWDSNNGEKANKPCAQCVMWSKLHDMLSAAPTAPDGWIPVSERMPIEFEAVIAFDGDQVYGEAMYSSDDGFTIDGYEPCDRLNLQNVTHWMPLPAAPLEVK